MIRPPTPTAVRRLQWRTPSADCVRDIESARIRAREAYCILDPAEVALPPAGIRPGARAASWPDAVDDMPGPGGAGGGV